MQGPLRDTECLKELQLNVGAGNGFYQWLHLAKTADCTKDGLRARNRQVHICQRGHFLGRSYNSRGQGVLAMVSVVILTSVRRLPLGKEKICMLELR